MSKQVAGQHSLRVLVTDGKRTADLFWLSHKGKDIYFGRPAIPGTHYSYHGSGSRHIKSPSGYEDVKQSVPLAKINGCCDLVQIVFGRAVLNSPSFTYSGKKAEAFAYIDVRSLPEDENYVARIGLLEPHAFKSLSMEYPHIQIYQVLLVPVLSPWVYVMTGLYKGL